ncbi:hypothetical protein LT85_0517 [Collimonas arenae]|uniref:Uncharacterized protein n=2 Tax=Collimonas arenae TaxID=279058 RepID=A0A0A1FA12_9BURK|nr:hypothetical protein LT85_0517 [Collimonas arenae]
MAALRSSTVDDQEQISLAQDHTGHSVALPASLTASSEPIFGVSEPAPMVGVEFAVSTVDVAPMPESGDWLIADFIDGSRWLINESATTETRQRTGISAGNLSGADEPPIAEVAGISDRTGYLAMSGAVGGVLLRSPLLPKKTEAIAPVRPGKRGAAYGGGDHDARDPSGAFDCRRHGAGDQDDDGLL